MGSGNSPAPTHRSCVYPELHGHKGKAGHPHASVRSAWMPIENPSIAEAGEADVGENDFTQGICAAGPTTSQNVWRRVILQHITIFCYDRLPQTGWLENRRVFLTVLKAGESQRKVPADPGPAEGTCPGGQMAVLPLCPHVMDSSERSKLANASCVRALIPE